MDRDDLVARCVEAVHERDPHSATRDVLERALADRHLSDELNTDPAGLHVLHHADDLTVLNVIWPPLVSLFAHDHRMWAAIGVYGGREDNSFYRRQGTTLIASGGKALTEGDVLLLGDDTVHSVDNPNRSHTGAIHVYGGDFLTVPRSQWEPPALEEAPYELDAVQALLARAEQQSRATDA